MRSTADPAVVDVGDAEELLGSGRTVVTVGGTANLELLIVRTRRGLLAVESTCPHMGRRLDDARVRGRTLTCHGHGRTLRFATQDRSPGRRERGECVRTVPVWISAGRLCVSLEPQETTKMSPESRA